MSEETLGNQMCFGCGRQNPIGLQLDFEEIEGEYITRFVGKPEHQGYDNIMHGGIVSTLLDEIMARYVYAQGLTAVTARLEVRFLAPTPIGTELTVTGRLASSRGRLYELTGNIRLPDGTITAEGQAKVFVVKPK